MSPRLSLVIVAMLLCGLLIAPAPAHAADSRQAAVTFSETELENHFPQSLAFHVHVEAGVPITAARLYFRFRNDSTLSRNDLTITPATKQVLTYRMVTAKQLAVPGTPILYYWEVTLEGGERVRSAEALTYYDDIRYEWDVREVGNLSLWTHDRTDAFAGRAFEIASLALEQQESVFGIGLDDPIRVIVYNSDAEFAAWHLESTELLGGQAFPALGITTQIVHDNARQDGWLNDVLPHEISHLYFFQVTYHPLAPVPAWLDEGVAQYNEIGDPRVDLRQVREDILRGKYIPLRALTGGFGHDEEKFGRSYEESRSAVNYLMERYGQRGLSELLAAYKRGLPTNEAFPSALGVTVEQFEADWLGSLGLPERSVPTPLVTEPASSGPSALTRQALSALTPSPTQPAMATSTPGPARVSPDGSPLGLFYLLSAACFGVMCLAVVVVGLLLLTRKGKPVGGGA